VAAAALGALGRAGHFYIFRLTFIEPKGAHMVSINQLPPPFQLSPFSAELEPLCPSTMLPLSAKYNDCEALALGTAMANNPKVQALVHSWQESAGAKGVAPSEPTARADVGADGVSLEARKAAMAEKSNAGGIHGKCLYTRPLFRSM